MDPDCLRTLYQKSASMFLLSCNDKNARKVPCKTARSLILNSLYSPRFDVPGNTNHRACIISNINSEVLGRGHCHFNTTKTAISPDVEEKEFSALEQKFADLRECASEKSSLQCKAQICSNFMSNRTLGNERKAVQSEFYCTACGLPYFTLGCIDDVGTSKIRLNTLKRGGTRRRRASRLIAAKFTFDNDILQKHRGGGKSFSLSASTSSHGSAVAKIMDEKVALKTAQDMRRTRDGISKHCITYSCLCGHSQSFKGFRRKNNSDRDDQSDKKSGALDKMAQIKSRSKRKLLDSMAPVNKPDEPNEDFLPLIPAARGTTNTTNTVSTTNLLSSGKKKRAKVKQGNKSSLHNFLSSLND